MTIFVLTQAMSCADEYIDITNTEVFTSLDKAREAMITYAKRFLNDERDDWAYDWGNEPEPVSVHLSCNGYEDEVVWAISEHEI